MPYTENFYTELIRALCFYTEQRSKGKDIETALSHVSSSYGSIWIFQVSVYVGQFTELFEKKGLMHKVHHEYTAKELPLFWAEVCGSERDLITANSETKS